MASEWKSKRYFKQYNHLTSSYVTFSDTSDAQTKIGFGSCWDIGTPTKTYALEDSGQTLVVTHEFSSEENQNSFMTALGTAWGNGSIFTGDTWQGTEGEPGIRVLQSQRVKTEWLHSDGSVSSTTNFSY
jgi:hypothetical protein